MTFTYPAVFFKNQYGYNVCFPDLEYLGTTGSTYEYALEHAREDMRAYILTQIETHQPLQKPTPLDALNIGEVENRLALPFTIESASKENITIELQ